jgi:hypothetical protein
MWDAGFDYSKVKKNPSLLSKVQLLNAELKD